MKTWSQRTLVYLSLSSLLFMVMAVTIDLIWIRSFNAGSSQPERVELFLQNFPSFFSLSAISNLKVLLCLMAIILSSISLKLKGIKWKILNISILVISGLGFIFSMFTLM